VGRTEAEPDTPVWHDRRMVTAGALEQVLAALPEGLHPAEVAGFLTTPNPNLGGPDGGMVSVLEWLDAGGDATVAAGLAADLDRW